MKKLVKECMFGKSRGIFRLICLISIFWSIFKINITLDILLFIFCRCSLYVYLTDSWLFMKTRMNHFTNSTCFPVQSIKKKGKHGKNFINVRKNYEKILHIFGLLLKKVKLFNYVTLRQEQNMCNFLFKPYNKIINAPSEKQPSLGELMN